MKKHFTRDNFINVVRLLLAITFLYAALLKGSDFDEFAIQIKKSPVLEPFNTNYVGIGVLVAEIGAALLLSFKKTLAAGLYAAFFIMLMFSAYLMVLYFGYKNIPCACGGILGAMSYPAHIVFNVALTLLSLIAILLNSQSQPG